MQPTATPPWGSFRQWTVTGNCSNVLLVTANTNTGRMSKQRKRRHDQVEENPSYQENVASIGPRPGPKASNKGGQDGHIETLMTKFSAKTRTTKEIEATVPGEP
eukprot:3937305-Rhodomonas_salina.16